jgi:hypothetical protein
LGLEEAGPAKDDDPKGSKDVAAGFTNEDAAKLLLELLELNAVEAVGFTAAEEYEEYEEDAAKGSNTAAVGFANEDADGVLGELPKGSKGAENEDADADDCAAG